MKKRPMVLIFAGILSGMAVVWNIMSIATAFYFFTGVILNVILIGRDRRYAWMIVGCLIGILFSVFSRISMQIDLDQVNQLKENHLTGKVMEVSKTKTGKQALLLKNETLEGKILLYTPDEKIVKEGDVVSFDKKIEIWEDASNPGQFSSRNYYFSKGIYYHTYAKTIRVKRYQRPYYETVIQRSRNYLKKQLGIQYKKEVKNFLNGMMLGDKSELSDEVKDDFKESGLIHLLAVSGLHISLAGRGVYQFVWKFCGNFLASSMIGMSSAVFYCILTGMSVSSLRAVLMLGVYFLSQILGEHYDILSSASFSGSVLLILWPFRIFDTGFLYSFLAVFVIGCYQEIKPKMKGNFRKIKESLVFCIMIQIGMFPLMIYFQYETPMLSFLANVVAVPLATTAFSMAFLLIFLPHTLLHELIAHMIEIILWIARGSYGKLTIGHVPFLWVLIFYALIFLCIDRRNKIRCHIRISLIYTGIILLLLIPVTRRKTIAFLDVGQGDCFAMDSSAGLIVFDGGSSSEDKVGRYRILPYMKYCGYQKIKIAMISHMDLDHYSGILELLEMGKIQYLGLPEIETDQAMEKIIKIAKEHGTQIFYLSRGRKIHVKDGELEVLHPEKESKMEKNAASLVLQGKALGYRVLLTGDVEKEGEEELLSQGLKHIEILKVAHHGSKNSTSDDFLQKVLPQQAIISCGKNNRYGHPHKEVIDRLKVHKIKIRRTDQKGAIIFREKRDG